MKGDSTRGRGRPRLDLSVEAAKEARREQLRLAQKTYKKRAATREGDEKARLNDRIARLEARLRVVEAENVALRRWFLQPSQADLSADVQIPPPPEKEIPHFDATHFEHLTAATAALKATPSLFRCQADAVPLIDALAALVSTFATNCMEQIASNQLACPIPQAPDIQGVKHALLALCADSPEDSDLVSHILDSIKATQLAFLQKWSANFGSAGKASFDCCAKSSSQF